MDMAVTSVNTLSLLTAIVPHCATSGFKMAEEGVVYASKCLGVMSKDELIGRKDGRKKIDVGELVAAMSRGLHGKSKQTKTSAKEGLTRRGFSTRNGEINYGVQSVIGRVVKQC